MRGAGPSIVAQQAVTSSNSGRAMGRGRFQLSNAAKYVTIISFDRIWNCEEYCFV